MTRYLAVRTKTGVRFYELGKNTRPLTVVKNHLFRTDETLMVAARSEDTEFVLYDLDETIPYGVEKPPSADETMAYIDIARSNKRAVSKISSFDWLTMDKLIPILLVVFVGYSYLSQALGGGSP